MQQVICFHTYTHALTVSQSLEKTFVLKTYQSSESAQAYFENDVNAFKKLARSDDYDNSIIKFHGNYTQGNTYNILLEYADKGDLEEYFQRELPPTLPEEIGQFWKGKFSKTIHNVGDEGLPQQSQCFQGQPYYIDSREHV
jgi:hypothetical protein